MARFCPEAGGFPSSQGVERGPLETPESATFPVVPCQEPFPPEEFRCEIFGGLKKVVAVTRIVKDGIVSFSHVRYPLRMGQVRMAPPEGILIVCGDILPVP